MKKIVPDPPELSLEAAASYELSLDRVAANRALDFYLLDQKPSRHAGPSAYAIPDSVNSEAALAQASDLLRCLGASAIEAGNGLSGHQRHLVLSLVHLAELAQAYVDKSLDSVSTH